MKIKELEQGSKKDRVVCSSCGNKDATTFNWLASNLWCRRCGGFGIEPFMKDWEKYNKKLKEGDKILIKATVHYIHPNGTIHCKTKNDMVGVKTNEIIRRIK